MTSIKELTLLCLGVLEEIWHRPLRQADFKKSAYNLAQFKHFPVGNISKLQRYGWIDDESLEEKVFKFYRQLDEDFKS